MGGAGTPRWKQPSVTLTLYCSAAAGFEGFVVDMPTKGPGYRERGRVKERRLETQNVVCSWSVVEYS